MSAPHPLHRTRPSDIADDIYEILRTQFADDDIFSVPNTPTIWVRRWNRWYQLDLAGPMPTGVAGVLAPRAER